MESSRKEKVRLLPRRCCGARGAGGVQWVWGRVRILTEVPAFPAARGQVLSASPRVQAEVSQRMAGWEDTISQAA